MASAADGYVRRAKALQQFQHDALKKHGRELRKKLNESAKQATGGDRALSGMGNTPKLSIRLRTEQGRFTSTVTLKPSPKAAKAPWVWIDSGTRAGFRRRRRSELISRREASVTGENAYYHPGTKGKGAWFGVTDRELPKIAAELRRQFDVTSR